MGQARNRGTFEERQRKAVDLKLIEETKRYEQRLVDRQHNKNKETNAALMVASMMALTNMSLID